MSSEGGQDRKPSVTKQKRNNKGRFQRQPTTPRATPLSSNKFLGETEELHGHIYDINTTRQSEMFTNTTKKVANYAGRTCKEPKDISLAIEELKDATFTMPTKGTTYSDSKPCY